LLHIEQELKNQSTLDDLISDQISCIRAGKNNDLLQRVVHLEKAKEKQIAAADRHRKAQIKNINQLYDFEVADAQALFERSYKEIQEELVRELLNERTRLLNMQQKSDASGSISLSTTVRSLRSSIVEESEGKVKSNKVKKRKSGVGTDGAALGLEEVISDASARADLLQIVQDMEQQARVFLDSANSKLPNLRISVNEDCSAVSIEGIDYFVGQEVSVFSTLSQETMTGTISAVTLRELIVRTFENNRFSVQLSLISSGRIIVSKENNILDRLQKISSSFKSS
jgi:hypothetical protein